MKHHLDVVACNCKLFSDHSLKKMIASAFYFFSLISQYNTGGGKICVRRYKRYEGRTLEAFFRRTRNPLVYNLTNG